eukprot:TRINITY_DN37933_c0_g1_i1.p1 TRINITY_DN37933_c0_g1~~TRINITY_DN37933_c0_g1_i1.p1  ORF type:complete len:244 (-),score=58.67 TRINITY_DN37933_c0_g1_i1:73-804(-)
MEAPGGGPQGLPLRATLDWLFPGGESSPDGDREANRPLGVAPASSLLASNGPLALGAKSQVHRCEEPWRWLEGAPVGDNADLLLDEDLLDSFAAVHIVKRQVNIKHSEGLFGRLCNQELMESACFSMRCVPTMTPDRVIAWRGGAPALGYTIPERWQLSVYYEPQRRMQVEAALEQLGQSISACAETPAEQDSLEQFLSYCHGCRRFCFMVKQGSEDIEVTNGTALDQEMKAWCESYEAGSWK